MTLACGEKSRALVLLDSALEGAAEFAAFARALNEGRREPVPLPYGAPARRYGLRRRTVTVSPISNEVRSSPTSSGPW